MTQDAVINCQLPAGGVIFTVYVRKGLRFGAVFILIFKMRVIFKQRKIKCAAFERFKKLADLKKEIYDEDLEFLVTEELTTVPEIYSLVDLNVSSGINQRPIAVVKLGINNEIIEKTEHGDGPVDAVFKAVASITGTKSSLLKYEVKAITGGTDALGEVVVSLEEDSNSVSGHGNDTDIIIASAKAYINALNKLAARKK